MNFRQTILAKIEASPVHSVFFISYFTNIAAMETVRKELNAAPRNFDYKGKTIPPIVQAFKELGTANIGETELNLVADHLSNTPDKETHASNLLMAPIWIQKILGIDIKSCN